MLLLSFLDLVQQTVSLCVCVLVSVTRRLFPEETIQTELNTKLSEGIRATSPSVHIRYSHTHTHPFPIKEAFLWAAETKADSHCEAGIVLLKEIRYQPVFVIRSFLP